MANTQGRSPMDDIALGRFRSLEMEYIRLVIPESSVKACVTQIGHHGTLQFVDIREHDHGSEEQQPRLHADDLADCVRAEDNLREYWSILTQHSESILRLRNLSPSSARKIQDAFAPARLPNGEACRCADPQSELLQEWRRSSSAEKSAAGLVAELRRRYEATFGAEALARMAVLRKKKLEDERKRHLLRRIQAVASTLGAIERSFEVDRMRRGERRPLMGAEMDSSADRSPLTSMAGAAPLGRFAALERALLRISRGSLIITVLGEDETEDLQDGNETGSGVTVRFFQLLMLGGDDETKLKVVRLCSHAYEAQFYEAYNPAEGQWAMKRVGEPDEPSKTMQKGPGTMSHRRSLLQLSEPERDLLAAALETEHADSCEVLQRQAAARAVDFAEIGGRFLGWWRFVQEEAAVYLALGKGEKMANGAYSIKGWVPAAKRSEADAVGIVRQSIARIVAQRPPSLNHSSALGESDESFNDMGYGEAGVVDLCREDLIFDGMETELVPIAGGSREVDHPCFRRQTPPTAFISAKLVRPFQGIVEAYATASYRELNPTPYTLVTFPFLFGLMFGDVGHGLCLLAFTLYCLGPPVARKRP
jgi:vacuolar-type H+-ATPase subunit I/STV1